MRIIKFRGKRFGGIGEWVYGSLIVWQMKVGLKTCIKSSDGEHNYEVDPATVGQFTGLHDKNGREIYEGDIIIKYFENPRGTPQERRIKVGIPDFYSDWFGLEGEYIIIGDIHDNPELLKINSS